MTSSETWLLVLGLYDGIFCLVGYAVFDFSPRTESTLAERICQGRGLDNFDSHGARAARRLRAGLSGCRWTRSKVSARRSFTCTCCWRSSRLWLHGRRRRGFRHLRSNDRRYDANSVFIHISGRLRGRDADHRNDLAKALGPLLGLGRADPGQLPRSSPRCTYYLFPATRSRTRTRPATPQGFRDHRGRLRAA